MKVPELRALTGARGIAAWIVVVYHVRGAVPGLSAAADTILAKGYLAVDFFFLLSGFVIWLSWHERLRTPGAVAAFLQKRIARIWPLHLFVLGAALVLALLLRLTGRDDPAFPLAELPLHVLLVQNWGFTRSLAWNDPAWSISAEMAAYCVFPLVAMAADWRRWRSLSLLALVVAILGALHLVMRGEPSLGSDIPRHGLIRCLAEFTVGGIVAALWQRHPGRAAWPVLVATALAVLHLLGLPETLVVPAALAALLLALASSAGRPGNPLEGRILHRLGEISYATYLSHFLLWKVLKLVAVQGAVTWGHLIAYVLILLMASEILYERVELPAQRRLNAVRLRPRRPALR